MSTVLAYVLGWAAVAQFELGWGLHPVHGRGLFAQLGARMCGEPVGQGLGVAAFEQLDRAAAVHVDHPDPYCLPGVDLVTAGAAQPGATAAPAVAARALPVSTPDAGWTPGSRRLVH